MKNKKSLFILIIILLALVALNIWGPLKRSEISVPKESEGVKSTISVKIPGRVDTEGIIIGEATVYDLMTSLREEGKVAFTEKEFSGLGILIEEINGVKNGEGYWLYYINDKQAETGISQQKLYPGDRLEWRYEAAY